MNDVYTSVPVSMENAGKAISDYNTRLGLTGSQLSGLSEQALAVSEMLGEDLNTTIEASSQAFQQWGISNQDMGKSMDYIFKVQQATGIGFNALMSNLKDYGPQLQALGFSFEQSAAMMGQMEKAGVRTDEIMAALKKSVGTMAKEGLSASEGIKKYYNEIKNAGDIAKATAIANEVFGARAGSSVADAIRKGTISADDFANSMSKNNEKIMSVFQETMDFPQKLKLVWHELDTHLEPLGGAIFDNMGDLIEPLKEAFAPVLPLIDKFVELTEPITNELFSKLADFISSCAPMFEEFFKNIEPLLDALIPIIQLLAGLIGGVLGQAFLIIMPIVNDFIGLLTNAIDFIVNVFTLQWGDAWKNVVAVFSSTFGLIDELAKGPINAVIAIINSVVSGINALHIQIPDWVPGMGGNEFGVKIPHIPMLAAGGFTDGVSIAGEDGTEAVISFNPSYRDKNLSIWKDAGAMLGATTSNSVVIDMGGINFAPNINVTNSSNSEDIMQRLKEHESEFMDMIEHSLKQRTLKRYC
ncbi:MAG: phage tail tape measure protein [Candidatus Gastranaerophilales bacterium]|nr:phage tail tape measure protein [Candidatus Gastranaerophilales bacterium]